MNKLYIISTRKIEDIGRYSKCLLDHGVVFHIYGERTSSHSILYHFEFKTDDKNFDDIVKELDIHSGRFKMDDYIFNKEN